MTGYSISGDVAIGQPVTLLSDDGAESINGYYAGLVHHCGAASLRIVFGDANGVRFTERTVRLADVAGALTGGEEHPHDPSPTLTDWHGDIVTPISLITGYGLHILGDGDSVHVEMVSRGDAGAHMYMTRAELVAFAERIIAEYK